ncbi:hypothetical protein BD770DRAFT_462691, partial [Pilaira anomala]
HEIRRSLPSSLQQEINQFAIDGFANKYFATHKRGLFRRTVPMKELLSWTKDSIKQPLLLDNKNDKDALKTFKIIQLLMHDRHRPRQFNFMESFQSLLSCGITKGQMRDEIYVQICRQLNKNPKGKYVTSKLTRICSRGARGKVLSVAEIERAMEAPFKPSVFGESLDTIMEQQQNKESDLKIPKIVIFLTNAVHELNGQSSEGIFRVPGDADAVTELVIFIYLYPNVPASLLKYWLRDLSEPLIPTYLYDDCIAHADDKEKAIAIIDSLPDINRRIVLYMIRFLQDFTDPKVIEITLMNVYNLAMVFAPNFLRCPSVNLTTIFENSKHEQMFVKTLITELKIDKEALTAQDYRPGEDNYSFKTIVGNETSHGFTIEYKKYYKVVTNLITSKRYCLVGWGESTPEDCAEENSFAVPVQQFSFEADVKSVGPFVELLGIQDRITSGIEVNSTTSPCVIKGSKVQKLKGPDLTFSNLDKMYHASFSASWILYLGAFFDLEAQAFSIYNQIVNDYECHRQNLGTIYNRKGISWTTFNPVAKTYTTNGDHYYDQLSQDAGATLITNNRLQDHTFNTDPVGLNLLVKALVSADIIIDTSDPKVNYTNWFDAGGLYFKPGSSFGAVKALDNKQVYTMHGLLNTYGASGKDKNKYMYTTQLIYIFFLKKKKIGHRDLLHALILLY